MRFFNIHIVSTMKNGQAYLGSISKFTYAEAPWLFIELAVSGLSILGVGGLGAATGAAGLGAAFGGGGGGGLVRVR